MPRPSPTTPALALLLAVGALAALVWWRVYGFAMPGGASSEQVQLLRELRVLRCASAVIVGSGLACAGVLLQSLLRNPLASPDLLGMSSGSGLGLMAAVLTSYWATGNLADPGPLGAIACGLLGALGALALVWACSRGAQGLSTTGVVLMGVVVGLVAAGGIAIAQHLLPDKGVAASRLLVGALRDDVPTRLVLACGGITLACVALALRLARAMDASTLGDDEAQSVGVALGSLRTWQFVLSGMLTACGVVLSGPIAFVGLLCPHAARLLIGARHGPRLLLATLLGACTLVLGDCLVQLLRELAPGLGRLPLGVLTSVVGGPVFVWMMVRKK
jgi:iron complex transport system permease protein